MTAFQDEYAYLLHLVRCVLHDLQPEEMPDTLSFDTVFSYADAHDIEGLTFYAVEKLTKKPDDALYQKWQQKFFSSLSRDMKLRKARDRIVAVLSQNGIRSLEVQGTVFKRFYPTPDCRTMSDIDFIIDPENLGKAKEVLLPLGFSLTADYPDEINIVHPSGVFVEVHTDFFNHKSEYHKKLPPPFDGAVRQGEELSYTAESTVFYLYSVLHFAKHYFRIGSGIRRMIDMYYLNHLCRDKIDEAKANALLTSLHLDDTMKKIFELADVWFDGAEPTQDFTQMEDMIFRSGTLGDSEQFLENTFRRDQIKGKRFIRLRYCWSLIFPDKDTLYAAMPYCAEHRYPVWLCRILRLFQVLFSPARIKKAFGYFKKAKETKIKKI